MGAVGQAYQIISFTCLHGITMSINKPGQLWQYSKTGNVVRAGL
jgi:hypothetical protein